MAASSDLAKAEVVAASIRAASGNAWACVVDVRKRAEVDAALAAAEKALGPIDIIVNSAGVYYATTIGSTSEADIDEYGGC